MSKIDITRTIESPTDQLTFVVGENPQVNTDLWEIQGVNVPWRLSVVGIDGSAFILKSNVSTTSRNMEVGVVMHNSAQVSKRNDYIIYFNLSVISNYVPVETFNIKNNSSKWDATVTYNAGSNYYFYYYIGDFDEIPSKNLFVNMVYGGNSVTIPPKKCLFMYGVQNKAYPISISGSGIRIEGDVACMLANKTMSKDGCLSGFLKNNTNITAAPELPSTALRISCYENLYSGCTGLITPPTTLSAGRVYDYSYSKMFYGCSNMTSTPTIQATTAGKSAFKSMFEGCTSITETARFTNTLTYVYSGTFESMYEGCTHLTKAYVPLASSGSYDSWTYRHLFKGCSRLTEIHNGCKIDPATAGNYFYEWLDGVCNVGTYYYHPNTPGGESRIRQYYGIPENWTLVPETSYNI